MVKSKKWVFYEPDDKKVREISQKYNISEITSSVIVNRNIDDIDNFFAGGSFHNPFLLTDMQKGVDRIKKAVQAGEKIAVYGDYDVDGITSTFILYDYLSFLGADITYYIPDRTDEGYGLNESAVSRIKSDGVSVIITVDVGITAVEEAVFCKQNGIDLIITDHHSLKDEIPDAYAVINPKRDENIYPFSDLAGVGVALKLVFALSDMSNDVFYKYCDIAAIGTIADMVNLVDENRFIAKKGLEKLKNTKNKGIKAVLCEAGLDKKEFTSATVGFGIAPRLNAAGRLSSAKLSVELLLENDDKRAEDSAKYLEGENRVRQEREQVILEEALGIIEKDRLFENNVIVVSGKEWHHGVIGIVASKITEKYYKPCIVISFDDDNVGKASGRSIKNFNLFEALNHCSDLLLKYGGHELAAGLSINKENLIRFCDKINDYANDILTEEILTPNMYIDCTIGISDINLDLIQNELSALEPFGIGNKSPIFCIENLKIDNIKILSNPKHALLTLSDKKGCTIVCPAFSIADLVSEFEIGDRIDAVGSLGTNIYRDVTRSQFLVKDLKLSKSQIISRDDVADVFRKIKSSIGIKQSVKSAKSKFMLCARVLKQLEIIDFEISCDDIIFKKGINFDKKTSLESSEIYRQYRG